MAMYINVEIYLPDASDTTTSHQGFVEAASRPFEGARKLYKLVKRISTGFKPGATITVSTRTTSGNITASGTDSKIVTYDKTA